MGFGDKLKGLKDQAQQAVAENKDKIQGAVQVVGEAANAKTHGKYATKIMKVGEKVEAGVDKFAQGDGAEDTAGAGGAAGAAGAAGAQGAAAPAASPVQEADSPAAPIVDEPVNPVSPPAADQA